MKAQTNTQPSKEMEGMYLRKSTVAFDNAIAKGMTEPEDWMYMYSKEDKDFFKNRNFRNYVSFKQ
jgi:hypothetical protein